MSLFRKRRGRRGFSLRYKIGLVFVTLGITLCFLSACPGGDDPDPCDECTGSATCCDGACYDLQTDAQACGACDNVCGNGESCVEGVCRGCPSGKKLCGASCILESQCCRDDSCKTGQVCRLGACVCRSGYTWCSQVDSCVDLKQSREHCGRCGVACADGRICRLGLCTPCPLGSRRCSGTNTCQECCGAQNIRFGFCREQKIHCVASLFYNAARGQCVECLRDSHCPSGSYCDNASGHPSFVCKCSGDKVFYNSSCLTKRGRCSIGYTNIRSMTRECTSGRRCIAKTGECVTGSTDTNLTECTFTNSTLPYKVYTDLKKDRENCGQCGQVCPPGAVCINGRCTCPSYRSKTFSDGSCRECAANRDCPTGKQCIEGFCEDACSTSRPCQGGRICQNGVCVCRQGLTDCNGVCRGLLSDPGNCGACGRRCGQGQLCVVSTCQCPPGKTLCGTECINTSNNTSHCGGCNRACQTGQTCTNGVCQCPSGLELCGGTCVSKDSDNSHCGACGNQCTNEKICVNRTCTCPVGKQDCNGACIPETNCCTDASCEGGKSCSNGICQ